MSRFTEAPKPLNRLAGEMDRMLGTFFKDFPGFAPFGVEASSGFPALNVWHDEDNVYVEAEMPGLTCRFTAMS
jgi:HSP20 family molecular chaperone IbpA